MNKNYHRIVFNAKRGQRMAVAETASAQSKSADGSGTRSSTRPGSSAGGRADLWASLHPVRLAIASALGLVLSAQPVAHAQIVVDTTAPRSQQATLLNTASGLPHVNITAPSAGGFSRNTFTQFDIQPQGAILNNSRTNVQTQLSGFVQGNAALAAGSARLILNEINSSNPSQLRG